MSDDKVVSETRLIHATPEQIFDLLADPSKHATFDGSGSVQSARGESKRLALGSTFGMNMKIKAPYRITNTVMEFEENRRIAWRHMGGHRWRYLLEPTDGGTLLTEQFDWSTSRAPLVLKLAKAPESNAKSITKTLDRFEELFPADAE